MLRLLVTKFWPVLIPIALYLLWLLLTRKKRKESKLEKAHRQVRRLTIIFSFIALIISLLVFYLSETKNPSRYYKPAELVNGKIKPAELRPADEQKTP